MFGAHRSVRHKALTSTVRRKTGVSTRRKTSSSLKPKTQPVKRVNIPPVIQEEQTPVRTLRQKKSKFENSKLFKILQCLCCCCLGPKKPKRKFTGEFEQLFSK